MAAVSLLVMIFVPIYGFKFHFNRETPQRKKGKLDELKVLQKKKTRRFFSSSLMLACAALLLIAGMGSYYASERLDSSIELTSKISEDSIVNLKYLLQDITNLLYELLGTDFDLATNTAMDSLGELPQRMNASINRQLYYRLTPYFDKLMELDNMVSNNNEVFQNFHNNVIEMQQLLAEARVTMAQLQTDLIALHTACEDRGEAPATCLLINYNDLKITNQDEKIPNITMTVMQMEGIKLMNISQQLTESKLKIANIGDVLIQNVNKTKDTIKNMTADMTSFKDRMMVKVDKTTEQIIKGTLEPLINQIIDLRSSKSFKRNDMLLSFILKIPCFIILLMFGLVFMALAIGQFGINHIYVWKIEESSPSMRMSRVAKDLLLSSLYIFFITSFFLSLLLSIFSLIGANMTLLSDSLKDDSFLEKIIDDNETWGGYPLSSKLHDNPKIVLKFQDIIRECQGDKSMWNIFKLSEVLNTSGIVDIRNKLPPLDNVIQTDELTKMDYLPKMENTSMTLEHVNKTLLESYKLIDFDLDGVITDVKEYSKYQFWYPDRAAAAFALVVGLSKFNMDIYQVILKKQDEMSAAHANLTIGINALQNISRSIGQLQKDAEEILNNDFSDILEMTFKSELEVVMKVLIRYGGYLLNELTTKVGKCNLIPETYETVKSLFCFYITDSINGLWLSLAIAMFSNIVFFSVYLEQIEHYRIGALDFQCNGDEKDTKSLIKFNMGKSIETSQNADIQWT